MRGSWTEGEGGAIEQLKAWWNEGYSAGVISRLFAQQGLSFSRSSICAKVDRLRDAGKLKEAQHGHSKPTSKTQQPRPRSVPLPRAPVPETAPEPEPAMPADGKVVTLLTVNDRQCRWPTWPDGAREFPVCGDKPHPGSPYCVRHTRKAWQRSEGKRA